jgi:hypothetical protein
MRNTLLKRPGRSDATYLEIRGALQPGDEVVSEGDQRHGVKE